MVTSLSFEVGLTVLHPSCILPLEGRSGSKPFPLTGKGWIGVRTVTYNSFFCTRAKLTNYSSGMKQARARLQFVGQHDAVTKRQKNIFDPRVVMNPIIQCVDNARVFFGWIEHTAVTQHIVEHDQPAFAC